MRCVGPMEPLRRFVSAHQLRLLILTACIGYAIILLAVLSAPTSVRAAMENKKFIASSPSWVDRQACRWLGICGGMNWWRLPKQARHSPPARPPQEGEHPTKDYTDAWIDPNADPGSWSRQERKLRTIPNYVLEYAPLVHLYGQEKYWPSDLAEHLENTYAKLEDDVLPGYKLRLWDLAELNKYNGTIFLTSKDDPETNPDWMTSPHNIPGLPDPDKKPLPIESTPGKRKGRKNMKEHARKEGWGSVDPHYTTKEKEPEHLVGDGDSEGEEPAFEIKLPSSPESAPDRGPRRRRRSSSTQVSFQNEEHSPGLRSKAPGFLICIDKGEGIIDAFWFYFYSFNEGNTVFGIRFGNHVGDWEHTMVRFQHGKPKGVYLSRHAWGSVYTYEALEKIGKRPVVYSGDGSHAHYPTPGRQDYVLPLGILHDMTSRGPLWDPVKNLKAYTYDPETENLRASTLNPKAPTSWFHFAGRWGDKAYDLSDRRQWRFFGEYHYVNGPTGPKFKRLRRKTLCENDNCNIQDHID